MAKCFHHATITVFLKPEETLDFLDALLPLSVKTFLEQQFVYNHNQERTKVHILSKQQAQLSIQEAEGFDGGLTVAKFTFKKITHTNKLFKTIYDNLPREEQTQLKTTAHELTDLQGKFTLRINKQELKKKKFLLAKGEAVQCAFTLAAYPKNETTITKCVEGLF